MERPPWWRGGRGEGYVVLQLALIAVIFFGPRTLPGWPEWPAFLAVPSVAVGVLLMLTGAVLLFASAFRLGPGLTPLPYPRDRSVFVRTGPYTLVRHPMYFGGLTAALGWALFVRGSLTLVWVVVLFVYFELKSTREERWLVEKFAEYPEYRRRVRKLIPFVH